MTVAFEIKYPWWNHRPWPKKFRYGGSHAWTHRMTESQREGRSQMFSHGYRETFITIWHVDPEKDGTDDSCGWSYPKLTAWQKDRLKNWAWHEGQHEHYLVSDSEKWDGNPVEAEMLYRGMVATVCRLLKIKVSYDWVCKFTAESFHAIDIWPSGSCFCFKPGYHTNFQEDRPKDREEHFYGVICGVAKSILAERRHWWQKPRWHFWHWKFQCYPLLLFKRWAFSRCSKCHGRIGYGESVVSNNWNSEGPKWFRSESDIICNRCSGCACAAQVATN